MWYTALPESGRIAFHIADLLLRVFKVGMPYQGAIAEDPHTIFSHHLLCWYNIVTVWCLRCHVPVRFPPDSPSKWPEKVVQMIVLMTWFDDKNVLSFEKDVPALPCVDYSSMLKLISLRCVCCDSRMHEAAHSCLTHSPVCLSWIMHTILLWRTLQPMAHSVIWVRDAMRKKRVRWLASYRKAIYR